MEILNSGTCKDGSKVVLMTTQDWITLGRPYPVLGLPTSKYYLNDFNGPNSMAKTDWTRTRTWIENYEYVCILEEALTFENKVKTATNFTNGDKVHNLMISSDWSQEVKRKLEENVRNQRNFFACQSQFDDE